MKLAAIIALVLTAIAGAKAQPAYPRPVGFTWDAPTDTADVIAYQLKWGDPDQTAVVPLQQTVYQVPKFPLAFGREVTVRSITDTTNSEPSTLYVYAVAAILEMRADGTDWLPVATNYYLGERPAVADFRMRLEAK